MPVKTKKRKAKVQKIGNKIAKKASRKQSKKEVFGKGVVGRTVHKMVENLRADEQVLHGQAHAIDEGGDKISYDKEEGWQNTDNYSNIGKDGKVKFISFK